MDHLKNQISDSKEPEAAFKLHGFYVFGSKYFTYEPKQKGRIKIELSNFVGESLFHLVNGTNNSKRILKIQRNTGEISIIEVQSSEMKLDSFETILKSKQCTFYGNTYQLKKIFAHWMDNEIQAHIIETLGWNYEHQVYSFANAIFTTNNKILSVNDVGIIHDPDNDKKKYYLPAFGLAHLNNQDYEGERKFIYIEGNLNFKEFSKLYFDAFGNNGGIAILFLILAVFWDIIFEKIGFFPFLFLFGAKSTGKTTLVKFLLLMFGKDTIGTALDNSTPVALSRTIASRNNSIFYLKEYSKETDKANQDLFLTAYDGSGRTTGIKSNDNKTKQANVRSAIILDGNELPTQKTAVLSRMILLNFEDDKFTSEQRKAYSELLKIQNDGFGKVLKEILNHREYFKQNFTKIFDENMSELRESISADFAERTINHIALLLVPAKLLIKRLQFPFDFNQITKTVVENAIEQNSLLKQSDEITIFWTAFAWNLKQGNLVKFNNDKHNSNKKESHYNIKIDVARDAVIQIRLQMIYPQYARYCKNNEQRYLDTNSLKMLLTSKSYHPFVPNLQKNRGDAYTDSYFGSCYQFRLKLQNNIYSINEVEIDL